MPAWTIPALRMEDSEPARYRTSLLPRLAPVVILRIRQRT